MPRLTEEESPNVRLVARSNPGQWEAQFDKFRRMHQGGLKRPVVEKAMAAAGMGQREVASFWSGLMNDTDREVLALARDPNAACRCVRHHYCDASPA